MMKKTFSLMLLIALLCTLFAGCRKDNPSASSGGSKAQQREKMTINACDYVYLSKSNERDWYPNYHEDALKAALIPYVKETISDQELQHYMRAFSVEEGYIHDPGDTVAVKMVVRENLVKGLEEISNVEFIWDDAVTIPLNPGPDNAKPQDTQKIKILDYFVFEPYGYNGTAEMRAYFDSVRYAKDYGARASEVMFSDNEHRFVSPEGYISIQYGGYRPVIHFSQKENLKNGDKITISFDAYSDARMGMEIEDQTIEYTVRGLQDFAPVDPFENLTVFSRGIENRTYAGNETVIMDKGEFFILYLDSNLDTSSPIHEGDVVHFSVSDWAKKYFGEEFFTRTEADIPVKLSTLPNQENAHAVFTSLSSIELNRLDRYDKETTWELVGMMLYYNNPDHEIENTQNPQNQLICVYKCSNDAMPQGWYSYTAHRNTVMLNTGFNLVTEKTEIRVVDDRESFLSGEPRTERELAQNYPISFTENGVEYLGHRSLSELFQAIDANLIQTSPYDHLAVSDSLKDQIEEF